MLNCFCGIENKGITCYFNSLKQFLNYKGSDINAVIFKKVFSIIYNCINDTEKMSIADPNLYFVHYNIRTFIPDDIQQFAHVLSHSFAPISELFLFSVIFGPLEIMF
jgi:ubiquitin C-terminal hydrolase